MPSEEFLWIPNEKAFSFRVKMLRNGQDQSSRTLKVVTFSGHIFEFLAHPLLSMNLKHSRVM